MTCGGLVFIIIIIVMYYYLYDWHVYTVYTMFINVIYLDASFFPRSWLHWKGCMKIVRERRKDLLHKTSLQVFVYCGLLSPSILLYCILRKIQSHSQTMWSHTVFEQRCINKKVLYPFQSMLINDTPMTLTRPYACCMSSRIRVEIACSCQRGVKNKSRAVIFVRGKVLERMVERTWKSQGNPPNGSEWSWNRKEILLKLSLFQEVVAWSNEFFFFFARFLPRKK